MNKRWLSLLFALLLLMTAVMFWHLFVTAKATPAASLIINILTPLNILLILLFFFVVSRSLIKLYLDRKDRKPGFKLRNKLVLAILPLTLLPAFLMFFIASQLPERILGNLSVDANIDTLIRNAKQLNESYLNDIQALTTSHGPQIVALLKNDEVQRISDLLQEHHIQAVEIYRDGSFERRVVNPTYDPDEIYRMDRTLGHRTSNPLEPRRFDDGVFVWRFPYVAPPFELDFVFTKPTHHTQRLQFIADSYAALDALRTEKESVSRLYQSTLLIMTLALIFGGIWMGMYFAKGFIAAFNQLIRGAEQVGLGNFDTQITLKTGDEIEDVVHAFNTMTLTLKKNQEELKQKARDLEHVNTQLSSQMQYTQTILQEVNTGILSTDTHGRMLTCNPAAQSMLSLTPTSLNEPIHDILHPEHYKALLNQWINFQKNGFRETSEQVELGQPEQEGRRTMFVTMVPLKNADGLMGSLIVLEDMTPLLHAQKLAAWREVARRVAHEIKNPLTPIQLSAQRIHKKVRTRAADLEQAVISAYETIMSETDILKNLVNEFSTFAKMPEPSKKDTDLGGLIDNVCMSYAQAFPHVKIEAHIDPNLPSLMCDPSQMRQVLSNLITNAAQASQRKGSIEIRLLQADDELLLEVADHGKGIPDAERSRIFIPYYSKSPKGTGLGLAIVKRIVQDHGGSIDVLPNHPRGTRFVIHLPSG